MGNAKRHANVAQLEGEWNRPGRINSASRFWPFFPSEAGLETDPR
jgi:hypothetical protein